MDSADVEQIKMCTIKKFDDDNKVAEMEILWRDESLAAFF